MPVLSVKKRPGAGVPRCLPKDLTITAGNSQGAAGTISAVFTMTNGSGHPCEMNGYPGIGMQYQDGYLTESFAAELIAYLEAPELLLAELV